jgi:threonine synthase
MVFFDDCQDMVKRHLDDSLTHHNLTSANSINIARWLPQMFYFFTYKELKRKKELVFSCPSGISEISVPVSWLKARLTPTSLLASTNINDTVPRF